MTRRRSLFSDLAAGLPFCAAACNGMPACQRCTSGHAAEHAGGQGNENLTTEGPHAHHCSRYGIVSY
jgi:hypothetical protein